MDEVSLQDNVIFGDFKPLTHNFVQACLKDTHLKPDSQVVFLNIPEKTDIPKWRKPPSRDIGNLFNNSNPFSQFQSVGIARDISDSFARAIRIQAYSNAKRAEQHKTSGLIQP